MKNTFRHCLIITCALLSIALPATSHGIQQADFPNDARIRIIEYHENDIYTIHTLYGYQTNVEFEEGEEIQTISVGDRSLWQLIPAGRRLFIRPMDENVSTNMTVITNLRSYQFDIISGKGEPKDNAKLIYVAKFIYPSSTAAPYIPSISAPVPAPVAIPAPSVSSVFQPAPLPATTLAQPKLSPPPAIPSPSVAPAQENTYTSPEVVLDKPQLNYLYSYSGKDELAPIDTHDNGTQTYIRFASAKQSPTIYLVDRNNKKTKIDTVRNNDVIVVPAVSERLLLDYGKGAQVYLYNETMNPTTVP